MIRLRLFSVAVVGILSATLLSSCYQSGAKNLYSGVNASLPLKIGKYDGPGLIYAVNRGAGDSYIYQVGTNAPEQLTLYPLTNTPMPDTYVAASKSQKGDFTYALLAVRDNGETILLGEPSCDIPEDRAAAVGALIDDGKCQFSTRADLERALRLFAKRIMTSTRLLTGKTLTLRQP